MSEKRFACKVKKEGDIEYVLFIDTREDVEYMSFFEILDLVNNIYDENEQLKNEINKYTPSIYNKEDGDWKWNVDNNTILNINNGEIFYLRNSGAVENLVSLLNTLHQENQELQEKIMKVKQSNNHYYTEYYKIEEENEQLKQTVQYLEGEIRARENDMTIIHRKNKELQTKNIELTYMDEQLREINKGLGDELYNCRLNKNTKTNKEKEEKGEKHKNCVLNKDAKYPCKAYEECLARKDTNKPLPCMVNWMMGNTFDNMIKKEKEND